MNTDEIKKELLTGLYAQMEEHILASMAAGVPVSDIRISGPEFNTDGRSIWLEGSVRYV